MKERLTLEEENQKTLERMTPEEEYQSAIENIGAVICFLGFVWCGMSANVITLVAGMCMGQYYTQDSCKKQVHWYLRSE